MKNLLFLFCLLIAFTLSAQNDDYEWTETDSTFTEEFELEPLELLDLPDLSVSFYAPLQTKLNTYTFDIPIQNKGTQATKASELYLVHKWVDAEGLEHQARRIESVPVLKPGQLYTLRIKLKDNSFRQLGHAIQSTYIYIDQQEAIAEQNEGNNIIRYIPGQFAALDTVEPSDETEEYYEEGYNN
ncbi:MAG: hypothetical protein Sapg2KO_18230 [Saprospiraceae bacterium]